MSESDLLRFRKMVREGKRVDYRKGENAIPLDLGLANETGFPHQGRLDYTDPRSTRAPGRSRSGASSPTPAA